MGVTKLTPANNATQVAVATTFIGNVVNPSYHLIRFEVRVKASQAVVYYLEDTIPTQTNFDFRYNPFTLLTASVYEWNAWDTFNETWSTNPAFTFTTYEEPAIEGVRIGYYDDVDYANFKQFSVIKQDISDTANTSVTYNLLGSGSSSGINKVTVNLDFDCLDVATLASLKDSILNSKRQLLFMKWPSARNHVCDFRTITNPSVSHTILNSKSASANLAYSGTQFTTDQYNQINKFPNGLFSEYQYAQDTHAYSYLFFKFVPTADLTDIQRLTLAIYSPYCYTGSTTSPFVIEAYNQLFGTWIEIARCDWSQQGFPLSENGYSSARSTFYATLKPTSGFTTMIDYCIANEIYFRMRNAVARTGVQISYLGIGYTYLMIDGFPVSLTSNSNFNFRNEFTGAGYSGNLEFTGV